MRHLLQAFPLRLLALQVKSHHLMLLSWLFLFSVVLGDFGRIMGIPYLFLDPEYREVLSAQGMALVGFAFGSFSISFHLSCYILDGDKFRFLSGLRRPFGTYYLNNGIIPTAFIVAYAYEFATFQTDLGLDLPTVLWYLACFMAGAAVVHGAVMAYFHLSPKGLIPLFSVKIDKELNQSALYRASAIQQVRNLRQGKYSINHFLGTNFRWRQAYDPGSHGADYIRFRRDHMAAILLEVTLLAIFFSLGYSAGFGEGRIPAAASGMMFFALANLISGILGYWLRGWSLTAAIVLLVAVNWLYTRGMIKNDYVAAGLDYHCGTTADTATRHSALNPDTIAADLLEAERMAQARLATTNGEDKGKAVILCFSGGGQRAALWAFRALGFADQATGGQLWNRTLMVTGASGGMVGAAAYREAHLRGYSPKQQDSLYNMLGRDLLNPIIFTYVSHDLPFRYRSYLYKGREYDFDRGRAWDQQFHLNTRNLLNKPLGAYAQVEASGRSPLLILSPIVASDGRKMFISTRPLGFMTGPETVPGESAQVSGVEFRRFYARNDPMNLDFITALRMNATFPYVMPNVSLPCDPPMRLMDAGVVDNFGISNAARYASRLRQWLEKNCSGIVILSIRDSPRTGFPKEKERQTLINQAFNPIGSIYTNWASIQRDQNEQLLDMLRDQFDIPIDFLTLEYTIGAGDSLEIPGTGLKANKTRHLQERASLSWHLTSFEKLSIYQTVHNRRNRLAVEQLKKVLGVPTLQADAPATEIRSGYAPARQLVADARTAL